MSSPASGQGSACALAFARAVLAAGHEIHRVFFLDRGTANGSNTSVYPQDAPGPISGWVELAQQDGVELVLCISSALKQGLLDETEAQRYERPAATAHPAFVISGLGQLVDASANSDRLITFGA